MPRAAWTDTPTDEVKVAWLASFLELGFIIFTGVRTESKTVLEVGSVFGFVRGTNFGAYFDVRSVPDANDLAYTSIFLDPHTDNPYRSPVPGVQLLHCLVNETSGGLSTLVDGYAAAEALRVQDSDAFGILARTPVRFRFRDTDTELVRSAPLIELDGALNVEAVNFSPRLDYVPLLRPQELAAYFRARKAFDQLLRSPRFEIRFLLEPGDLMMGALPSIPVKACGIFRGATSILMGRAACIVCYSGDCSRLGVRHELNKQDGQFPQDGGWNQGGLRAAGGIGEGVRGRLAGSRAGSRAQARSLAGGLSSQPARALTPGGYPGPERWRRR
jgi:hypothetical protein